MNGTDEGEAICLAACLWPLVKFWITCSRFDQPNDAVECCCGGRGRKALFSFFKEADFFRPPPSGCELFPQAFRVSQCRVQTSPCLCPDAREDARPVAEPARPSTP